MTVQVFFFSMFFLKQTRTLMPLRGLNSSEMTVLVGFIFINTYTSIYNQNMLHNLKAQLTQFTEQ